MPSIWSFLDNPELADFTSLDMQTLQHRAERLNDLPDLKNRLKNLFLDNKAEFEESPFVERKIYSGFPSRRDENLMSAFHKLDWEDRWPISQSFEDERCKELGERLIFFHAPESMPLNKREKWVQKVQEKLYSEDPDCEWLTFTKAINQLEALILKQTGAQKKLLEGHRVYLEGRLAQ